MKKYVSPYFGKINLNSPENDYDVEVDIGKDLLYLELCVETDVIELDKLKTIENFIDQIDYYDKLNRKYIDLNYHSKEKDTAKFYVDICLKWLDKEDLAEIVDLNHPHKKIKEQILDNLKLVRVGFSTHPEQNFVTFDYTIDEDLLNDLIVIFYDHNLKFDSMTIES